MSVMMTSIASEMREKESWIVVELNPARDLLQSLAAKLYSLAELHPYFIQAKLDFAAFGIGVSLENAIPVTDIENAIELMLAEIQKRHMKLLITIDGVTNCEYVRIFSGSYQIFIASGPGIRVIEGNEYAHLAFLNSRIAAYYVRMMSPKLTIAAGYIGQIPINDKIYSSVVLEKEARLCIELKRKMLSARPNNIEYESAFIQNLSGNLLNDAWRMLNDDLTNELLKLEVESKIDQYIFQEYGLSEEEEKHLQDSVGECAYLIDRTQEIDIGKLDKYLEKLMDASCCLKRTRASKNSLGSDGILEYIAKDLGVNPERVVEKIQEKPFEMKRVLTKYMDMILHNFVLYKLGYNTDNGVQIPECTITEMVSDLTDRFGEDFDYGKWLQKSFNKVHSEIFKGVPYLQYGNGVIHKYDSKAA